MANMEKDLEAFIAKADQAHNMIQLLQSKDDSVVEETQKKIDKILENDWEDEDMLTTTFSKSHITKISDDDPVPCRPEEMEEMGMGNVPENTDQDGFMRMVEQDANKRAANRKVKEEKAAKQKEKGNNAFKKGEYLESIKHYDIAIKLTGWNVSFYTNKAQAHIKLEDYDGAITDCDRALYIEEGFVKAYIQKSNALLCKEEFTAAVECLEECVKQCGTGPIVERYLKKAQMVAELDKDNKDIISTAAVEEFKEIEHLVKKMDSDKNFEVLISSEFLEKKLRFLDDMRLFRALGGVPVAAKVLSKVQDAPISICVLDILKRVLVEDKFSLYVWLGLDNWATSLTTQLQADTKTRLFVLLLIEKLLLEESVGTMFVEGWSDVQFTKSFLEGLNDDVTRSITALEIGQLLKFDTFYNRFHTEVKASLLVIQTLLVLVPSEVLSEQKTWIAALAGLSTDTRARKVLDEDFWKLFLVMAEQLDNAGEIQLLDDLLIAGQNFSIDSTVLATVGESVTQCVIKLCGQIGRSKRAPLLLNRILDKCPNSVLVEDKAQFAAILKIIRDPDNLTEDMCTAVKILTRSTAVSVQARKWVVKYKILDKLIDLLDIEVVDNESFKTQITILSNAALCCAHCFQDDSVCKKMDKKTMDIMLKHAKSEKGTAIQQNSAIALARLATNAPEHLARLRELNGLEILYSRFSLPETSK